MWQAPLTMAEQVEAYIGRVTDQDASICACHGDGWVYLPLDTYVKCPVHYRGQRHPEDEVDPFWYTSEGQSLLMTNPDEYWNTNEGQSLLKTQEL